MAIPDTTVIPPILSATEVVDWFAAANQAVRNFCGWHVTPAIIQTLRPLSNGSSTLLLRTGKLNSLLACTNDGVDVLADVEFSESGMLELRTGAWSTRLGGVVVQIDHGYAYAPDVAGLIATLAARGGTMPAGIISQSVGPASVRYGDIPMMAGEQATLESYRIAWGT